MIGSPPLSPPLLSLSLSLSLSTTQKLQRFPIKSIYLPITLSNLRGGYALLLSILSLYSLSQSRA